jgi:hypothetical protein
VLFTVLVALLVAALVLVTVAPLFVALQMADARRFSTGRWGALAGGAVVVGVAASYVLHSHDAPRLLVLLPLLVTWAGPAALWMLEPGESRFGGRAGLHE